VYLIVEADDVEDARRQVGPPGLRQAWAASFEFEPVEN